MKEVLCTLNPNLPLDSSRNCIFSTTLGSIRGGKGKPVIITARPLLSAKSRPSLTCSKTSFHIQFKVKNQIGYHLQTLDFILLYLIHNKEKIFTFPLHTATKMAPFKAGSLIFS